MNRGASRAGEREAQDAPRASEAGWSSETGGRGAEAKSSSPQYCKFFFNKFRPVSCALIASHAKRLKIQGRMLHDYSVLPIAGIPGLDCLIKDYLLSHPDLRFHEMECFKNSWKLMRISSKIEYVEGYCYRDEGENKLIAFHHAWNIYKGLAFDYTSEHLFNGLIGNGVNKYTEVIRTGSRKKARSMMRDRDMEAGLLIRNSFPGTAFNSCFLLDK